MSHHRSCRIGNGCSGQAENAMHAMVLKKLGSALEWTEIADRQPAQGQIRVKVTACGVCRTDLHVVDGELPDPKLPIIPGHGRQSHKAGRDGFPAARARDRHHHQDDQLSAPRSQPGACRSARWPLRRRRGSRSVNRYPISPRRRYFARPPRADPRRFETTSLRSPNLPRPRSPAAQRQPSCWPRPG
jgi:Alcohol dehydrogenase GroES-like domain